MLLLVVLLVGYFYYCMRLKITQTQPIHWQVRFQNRLLPLISLHDLLVISYAFHSIIEYYAQPGVHSYKKCRDHYRIVAKGHLYPHQSCICTSCKETIVQLPPLLQKFLTAANCKSLYNFKQAKIEIFQDWEINYYYCKPVTGLWFSRPTVGLTHRPAYSISWL